jgi:ribulose-phosphate 3-epimerase
MNRMISPSLLAADFANLQREIEMVNSSQADFLHLDIMDGVFVPNISFGLPVVKTAARLSVKPLDVHLMIVEPERYIHAFREAGAAWLTVHMEACRHLNRTISEIHEQGMKAGVSLNPHTPVSTLEEIIPYVDLVLIMSVNPGFGGQRFIETSYEKIRKTRELITASGSPALIEVDGGVDADNAARLYDAGVDILVAGTTVFSATEPLKTIEVLKRHP